MEKSLIIISIIILALFFIPLIILFSRKSKKVNSQLKKFQNIGATLNLHLSEQDVWEDHGIGIDRELKHVFYAKGKEFSDMTENVDLEKVRRSEVNKVSRSLGSMNVVDRIDLRIIFKDSNSPHLLLEFYNVHINRQIYDEYHLAEKWSKVINECV